MAASPQFKVYAKGHGYVGSLKFAEDAAALAALHGDGATIRWGHSARDTLWTEGLDGNAAESYDAVATVMQERMEATR